MKRIISLSLVVMAVLSVFAVAFAAEEPASIDSVNGTHYFSLSCNSSESKYTSGNAKTNARSYASIDIGSRSFESSPQYIYMSVCSDQSGTRVTSEVSPSSDGFSLTYNVTPTQNKDYYLRLRTEHRAASCSGNWTS